VLPCDFLDEELIATLDSPSFDVDAILGCLEVPTQVNREDTASPIATVPTTPPAAALATERTAPSMARRSQAKIRTATAIRTPTRDEILAAVESDEVLLATRRQWADLMAQAESVLSPDEVAELKKRRRRAKGVVDARNARVKKRKGFESHSVEYEAAMMQNAALTAKVTQMAADNAVLQNELAALRSKLATNISQ
jgi:hypothetical protein